MRNSLCLGNILLLVGLSAGCASPNYAVFDNTKPLEMMIKTHGSAPGQDRRFVSRSEVVDELSKIEDAKKFVSDSRLFKTLSLATAFSGVYVAFDPRDNEYDLPILIALYLSNLVLPVLSDDMKLA